MRKNVSFVPQTSFSFSQINLMKTINQTLNSVVSRLIYSAKEETWHNLEHKLLNVNVSIAIIFIFQGFLVSVIIDIITTRCTIDS